MKFNEMEVEVLCFGKLAANDILVTDAWRYNKSGA
jgi:hypothetical protein